MDYFKLNSGTRIPVIGSGTNTFGKIGNDYNAALRGDSDEVDGAIENGYRHFDTAQLYRNEKVLGDGIKKSGISREEFFITTKLNTVDTYHGEAWVHEEITKSLERLDTNYLDLFLLHAPWDSRSDMISAWTILEDYYDQGIFKAIGVSNFEKEHLDILLSSSRIKPQMNQIESHTGHWNDELIAYNEANDIRTTAWSPLRGVRNHPVLTEIGKKYGKTPAQLALRYQIQRGVVVIPKSHDKAHQRQSLDIFNFELSAEDRAVIAAL